MPNGQPGHALAFEATGHFQITVLFKQTLDWQPNHVCACVCVCARECEWPIAPPWGIFHHLQFRWLCNRECPVPKHFSVQRALFAFHTLLSPYCWRLCHVLEGTFARCAPGIRINVPVIHPNALPLNITPSSSPGTLGTNDTTKHNCRWTKNLSCIVTPQPKGLPRTVFQGNNMGCIVASEGHRCKETLQNYVATCTTSSPQV